MEQTYALRDFKKKYERMTYVIYTKTSRKVKVFQHYHVDKGDMCSPGTKIQGTYVDTGEAISLDPGEWTDDLEQLTIKVNEALKKTGKKLILHNCSLCKYPCGWLYINDALHFDSGCDCTTYNYTKRPVSLLELDEYFNGTYGGPALDKEAKKFISGS